MNEIWRQFLKCYAICLGALLVLVEILYRSQEKNCSKEDRASVLISFFRNVVEVIHNIL